MSQSRIAALFLIGLFAFTSIAAAQGDSDAMEADAMCKPPTSTRVYRTEKPWNKEFKENNKTYFNLYGVPCQDIENGSVAASGHCIASNKCLATKCAGGTCQKPSTPVDTSKNDPSAEIDLPEVCVGSGCTTPTEGETYTSGKGDSTGTGQNTGATPETLDDSDHLGEPSSPSSKNFSEQINAATKNNTGFWGDIADWFTGDDTPAAQRNAGDKTFDTEFGTASKLDPDSFDQFDKDAAYSPDNPSGQSTFGNEKTLERENVADAERSSECSGTWSCWAEKTAKCAMDLGGCLFNSEVEAKRLDPKAGESIVKATEAMCKIYGCDATTYAQALGGSCVQESQCDPKYQHVSQHGASQYQGLGQLNRQGVENAYNELVRAYNSGKLSPEERAEVAAVLNKTLPWINNVSGAPDPRFDPVAGSYLFAARNAHIAGPDWGKTEIFPITTIQQIAPGDALMQSQLIQATQLAPSIHTGGQISDWDKPLTYSQRMAFGNNGLGGATTLGEVLDRMDTSNAYGRNLSEGVNWIASINGGSTVAYSPPAPALSSGDLNQTLEYQTAAPARDPWSGTRYAFSETDGRWGWATQAQVSSDFGDVASIESPYPAGVVDRIEDTSSQRPTLASALEAPVATLASYGGARPLTMLNASDGYPTQYQGSLYNGFDPLSGVLLADSSQYDFITPVDANPVASVERGGQLDDAVGPIAAQPTTPVEFGGQLDPAIGNIDPSPTTAVESSALPAASVNPDTLAEVVDMVRRQEAFDAAQRIATNYPMLGDEWATSDESYITTFDERQKYSIENREAVFALNEYDRELFAQQSIKESTDEAQRIASEYPLLGNEWAQTDESKAVIKEAEDRRIAELKQKVEDFGKGVDAAKVDYGARLWSWITGNPINPDPQTLVGNQLWEPQLFKAQAELAEAELGQLTREYRELPFEDSARRDELAAQIQNKQDELGAINDRVAARANVLSDGTKLGGLTLEQMQVRQAEYARTLEIGGGDAATRAGNLVEDAKNGRVGTLGDVYAASNYTKLADAIETRQSMLGESVDTTMQPASPPTVPNNVQEYLAHGQNPETLRNALATEPSLRTPEQKAVVMAFNQWSFGRNLEVNAEQSLANSEARLATLREDLDYARTADERYRIRQAMSNEMIIAGNTANDVASAKIFQEKSENLLAELSPGAARSAETQRLVNTIENPKMTQNISDYLKQTAASQAEKGSIFTGLAVGLASKTYDGVLSIAAGLPGLGLADYKPLDRQISGLTQPDSWSYAQAADDVLTVATVLPNRASNAVFGTAMDVIGGARGAGNTFEAGALGLARSSDDLAVGGSYYRDGLRSLDDAIRETDSVANARALAVGEPAPAQLPARNLGGDVPPAQPRIEPPAQGPLAVNDNALPVQQRPAAFNVDSPVAPVAATDTVVPTPPAARVPNVETAPPARINTTADGEVVQWNGNGSRDANIVRVLDEPPSNPVTVRLETAEQARVIGTLPDNYNPNASSHRVMISADDAASLRAGVSPEELRVYPLPETPAANPTLRERLSAWWNNEDAIVRDGVVVVRETPGTPASIPASVMADAPPTAPRANASTEVPPVQEPTYADFYPEARVADTPPGRPVVVGERIPGTNWERLPDGTSRPIPEVPTPAAMVPDPVAPVAVAEQPKRAWWNFPGKFMDELKAFSDNVPPPTGAARMAPDAELPRGNGGVPPTGGNGTQPPTLGGVVRVAPDTPATTASHAPRAAGPTAWETWQGVPAPARWAIYAPLAWMGGVTAYTGYAWWNGMPIGDAALERAPSSPTSPVAVYVPSGEPPFTEPAPLPINAYDFPSNDPLRPDVARAAADIVKETGTQQARPCGPNESWASSGCTRIPGTQSPTNTPPRNPWNPGDVPGQKPYPGQILDSDYYCITSIQPVLVRTVPAGTPFPSNCINGANGGRGGAGSGMSSLGSALGQFMGRMFGNNNQNQQQNPNVPTPAPATTTITRKPSASITANPALVRAGSTTRLSWTSTYAETCAIFSGDASLFPTLDKSGSTTTPPIATSAVFKLTCTGASGAANSEVSVGVQ